jgi:hypothetical protein
MKTLYKFTAPHGAAKVRLVERRTLARPSMEKPPMERTSFAVILNVKGDVAVFDAFHDIGYAASAFANICDRFGGVTGANQVVAL